jgi:hypothetical protein
MFATSDVRQIEDRRIIEELLAEQQEDARGAYSADVKRGKDHSPRESDAGIKYRKCGGGRHRMPHRGGAY